MAPKSTNLATLFADISGSTQIFEQLGDAHARIIISQTLDQLIDITHKNKGKLIKTIGDEIMCIFSTSDLATNAAIAMQEQMHKDNQSRSDDEPNITVRIGIQYGSAIVENNDVFGDVVNVAARMVAQSKGGQIITAKSTVDTMSAELSEKARFVDHAVIKGKQDKIEIYEVVWQEEDITRMTTNILKPQDGGKNQEVKLKVTYGNTDITLNQKRPSIVMGRSNACDLPVNEKLASRQHVKIEMRKNKFFIIDQSTNGTHVLIDNMEESFLRREEMQISSSGKISLGLSFTENPTEVVKFTQI